MKKTIFKIVALVLLSVISCIWIYYTVDKAKPASNTDDILIVQNNLENNFINDTNYTFEDPKIIVNPYGISPLTALVIYQTKDLVSTTVEIKGKDELTTYTNTFKPSKIHILPIYGLYADTDNEIIIKENGKTKKINIKTDKLPDDFVKPTLIEKDEDNLTNDLYFVTPSSTGYTAAYDVNGDVRWYLTDNFIWDIQRLNNGHLLLSSNRLINPPYYTVGLVEMDLLGKIYYEYTLPGGYHHDVFEMENGNFLIASDNFDEGTVEDYIVEMDRSTGNIINEYDLKDIIPTEEGNNAYTTDYDWFHNNSVWYDKNTNSITLSGRHKDAVINIDYTSKKLNWILGDSTNWSDKYKKYFFSKKDDTEWQYAQHAAMVLPNGNIFLFDNGNNRSKIESEYISSEDNYSRGVIYKLDKENMTAEQVFEYGKELGSDFYSPYISDVDYLDDNHYIIHSGGTSYKDGKVLNDPAGMTEYDSLKSTTVELLDDEEIFRMELPTNTYRVEKLSLYANDEYQSTPGIRLGNLGETKTDKKNPLLIFNKKIDKKYKSHNISITKETDRLVINGTFKKSDKVKIILDNVFDKKTYNMVISKKPYTAMCVDVFNKEEEKNGINVTKYINNIGISGKYYVYIEINNKIYDTDTYVNF